MEITLTVNNGGDTIMFRELLAKEFKRCRHKRGITQREMAYLLEMTENSYARLESGKTTAKSLRMRRAVTNTYYTKEERERLANVYIRMLKGREANFIATSKKKTAAERVKEFVESTSENRDKYRIPNIDGFYEELNALGDISELDKNDPRLQALRVKVGGDRIMTALVSSDKRRKGV